MWRWSADIVTSFSVEYCPAFGLSCHFLLKAFTVLYISCTKSLLHCSLTFISFFWAVTSTVKPSLHLKTACPRNLLALFQGWASWWCSASATNCLRFSFCSDLHALYTTMKKKNQISAQDEFLSLYPAFISKVQHFPLSFGQTSVVTTTFLSQLF